MLADALLSLMTSPVNLDDDVGLFLVNQRALPHQPRTKFFLELEAFIQARCPPNLVRPLDDTYIAGNKALLMLWQSEIHQFVGDRDVRTLLRHKFLPQVSDTWSVVHDAWSNVRRLKFCSNRRRALHLNRVMESACRLVGFNTLYFRRHVEVLSRDLGSSCECPVLAMLALVGCCYALDPWAYESCTLAQCLIREFSRELDITK